jgi:hypothetical protein
VAELGRHPAALAGLDLAQPEGRAQWLVLARLLSERARDDVVLAAFARLAAEPGASPAALAGADPGLVAAALEAGGLRRAESAARVLWRAGCALRDGYDGDLEALAAGSDGFEDLGGRLAALAPGLGAATVLRFLRPLRDAWPAARETPLAEPARAAAVHLGWIAAGEDLDGEPAALRAAAAEHAGDLDPNDLEAALERLGARACLRVSRGEPEASEDQRRERTDRCPFGAQCPVLTKPA